MIESNQITFTLLENPTDESRDDENQREEEISSREESSFGPGNRSSDWKQRSSHSSTIFDDRAKSYIRFVQYLNITFSSISTIYFVYLNQLNIALEYAQIAFSLSLLISLDSRSKRNQRIWIVHGVLIGILWTYIIMIDGELDFPIENLVLTLIASLFFLGGMLYCTIIINQISPSEEFKLVELDLLLYFVALNAICFVSDNGNFNNNLHMILDIRMMVVLFNGLYQWKNKMKLLRLNSFLIVMFLIILSFIIYTKITPATDLIANSVYVIVGFILIYEAWIAIERCQILTVLRV